ncbi:TetR/AcrR family transcriptional regulator [Agromyces mangrovi Wang et al. 2018]|uniref:TetR/AcrR family transcriptional regulator n=1 Tax=Agromyces mangrovi TaxID=1858653 RepID=UPI0025741A66|nr:TetR/AcrR family transcriptional regulator [Agromyces mangrovi]BDZ66147.1 hypothetical protein GCM10025877_30850 [Agromyces mangrovi]
MAGSDTRATILAAARTSVLRDGFAALSTRKVADEAGVPQSQIHYHFGTREQLVLSVLEAEDASLVARQAALYAGDEPLSAQWARACDYLDDDLDSGYVRILHEMMAAGWSTEVVGERVRRVYDGWTTVLTDAAERASARGIRFGGLTPAEVATLVGAAFVGAEAMILSGTEGPTRPFRDALRAIGRLIAAEEARLAALEAEVGS